MNTLSSYKGLTLGKEKAEAVSEEEVNQELNNMLQQADSTKEKEGKSENGDIVNIDFKGFVDGVAFEGGEGKEYDLELGSHSFIPGFEEQLVGFGKDDDVEVKVKFPEDYQAENLKGKDAIFKCKIHQVKQKVKAELNDEFAQKFGIDTFENMKKTLTQEMNTKKQNEANNKYLDKLFDEIREKSSLEVAPEEIAKKVDQILAYQERSLTQYGLNLDSYLQMMKTDKESFMKTLQPQGEKAAKDDVICKMIAIQENLLPSDEEVDSQLHLFQNYYKLSDEQVADFKAKSLEDFKLDIIREKVCLFLIQSNN